MQVRWTISAEQTRSYSGERLRACCAGNQYNASVTDSQRLARGKEPLRTLIQRGLHRLKPLSNLCFRAHSQELILSGEKVE